MTNEINTYFPIEKENEEKVISFFIKNSKEINRSKEKFFFDTFCRILFLCIKEINDDGLVCDVDILFDYAKKKDNEIKKSEIQRIFNDYTNFENIKIYINKIKDFYLQNNILKKVEEIANKSLDKKELDKEGIKNFANLLEKDISFLGGNEGLLTTKDIAERYREEQKKRQKGERKRSLGFNELDNLVTRPGQEEEMSVLVGMKGYGKSAFKSSQQNNLINDGVCVVAFEPEMPLVSNIDRLISIRSGLSIFELLKKDKDSNLQKIIEREIRKIEAIPNFLYFEEASLDLYLVRDLIRKAKQIFSDKGVLPDDEYIFSTFDTFDMLEEFEDADPKRIKANMNKFHRMIVRKEKIHSELILQANENKIRGRVFKNPDELDYFKIGKEDIEGGAAYAAKARVVMSINRPVQMKKEFFPNRMEEWNNEMDLLNIHGVKQNDGPLFFTQFSFNENMRIYPHR